MGDIHSRIKARRLKLEMSMEALAQRVGVRSWQTVQQWENGSTAPKRARAEKVAEVLGMSVSELVSGDTNSNRPNVRSIAGRRSDDHPAIAEVIRLMLEMDDIGKNRLAERAISLAEQYPAKANSAQSSQ